MPQVSRELSLFKCMEHPNIIKGISSFLDDKAVYLLQVRLRWWR